MTPLRGAFYLSARDGARAALLVGPFETYQQAAGWRDRAVQAACQVDGRAWFYAYGVCRFLCFPRRRPGKLNGVLGLAVVIEDPWR